MTNFTSDFDREAAGYSPDRLGAMVWAATDLLLQDMKGYAFYEVARQRAAGEPLEQIAVLAESTPEWEKKSSLLEVYKQGIARYQKSSGPMPG